MKEKRVTEGKLLALLDGHVANTFLFALKIVDTKRVGCDQAIVSSMPPCGMPRVLRMIKNRNPHGVPVYLTPVVDPLGPLAPEGFILVPSAVDRLAIGCGHASAVAET